MDSSRLLVLNHVTPPGEGQGCFRWNGDQSTVYQDGPVADSPNTATREVHPFQTRDMPKVLEGWGLGLGLYPVAVPISVNVPIDPLGNEVL